MAYTIREVDGFINQQIIHDLNALAPEVFPPLTLKHLRDGFWWLAHDDNDAVIGFAGMVPMRPFPKVAYLKRCLITKQHRGHGLQVRMIEARLKKAAASGFVKVVTECAATNLASRNNLAACGFTRCEPEQPWGSLGSIYLEKVIG